MLRPPQKIRKADLTRSAILNAAQVLFAENGYDRTSIRDISAKAAIDPAMVIRYFGSKDELFARAAVFDLKLPASAKVHRGQIGETLIRHFLEIWEGEHADQGLAILLRSATSNAFAARKVREIFAAQVLPALRQISKGTDMDQRAGLIVSQLLGLALCRYILKITPLSDMPPETIIQTVGLTIQNYVEGSLGPGKTR